MNYCCFLESFDSETRTLRLWEYLWKQKAPVKVNKHGRCLLLQMEAEVATRYQQGTIAWGGNVNKQERKARQIQRQIDQCWEQHDRAKAGQTNPTSGHKPARRNWRPRSSSTHRIVGATARDEFRRAQAREQRRRVRDQRDAVVSRLATV